MGTSEARQMLEHAIEMGRGGISPPADAWGQYARLKRP